MTSSKNIVSSQHSKSRLGRNLVDDSAIARHNTEAVGGPYGLGASAFMIWTLGNQQMQVNLIAHCRTFCKSFRLCMHASPELNIRENL